MLQYLPAPPLPLAPALCTWPGSAPVAHRARQRVCHRLCHIKHPQAGGVCLGPRPSAAQHRDAAPVAGRQQRHLQTEEWSRTGQGIGQVRMNCSPARSSCTGKNDSHTQK